MLKRVLIRSLLTLLSIITILAIISAIGLFWYFNRPLPESIDKQVIFEGVSYSRIVDDSVPLVIHVIEIDLSQPDIRFFATPADDIEGYDYAARTTSGFLQEFDLQIAINGDFFDPWYSYSPFDYYPEIGDGVNARGLSMTDGEIASNGYAPDASSTLYITADNQASFIRPDVPIQTAISGNVMLLENGAYIITEHNDYLSKRHPRTAIALNQAENMLLLFVVDGRQPNYSEGATMPEFAQIIIQSGGYTALNLDGGGSVAMVMADENANPVLLNSAIHTRIPYRERPIANHFGVYAATNTE